MQSLVVKWSVLAACVLVCIGVLMMGPGAESGSKSKLCVCVYKTAAFNRGSDDSDRSPVQARQISYPSCVYCPPAGEGSGLSGNPDDADSSDDKRKNKDKKKNKKKKKAPAPDYDDDSQFA